MNVIERMRRYALFTLGIFVIALGISVFIRTNLGTPPFTSTPYVFSQNTSLSVGTYVFTLFMICMLVQLILLGKKGIVENRFNLLAQIPISFLFGFFTDLTMWMLSDFAPEGYVVRLMSLFVGCVILAIGISLEVVANVFMTSSEYTIQIISKRFNKEFGVVKMFFDITLVTLAVISSLLFSSTIIGVREGTVIAALVVGPIVKITMPRLGFVSRWLSGSKK
ncbi:MAG: DUF6198 family protein [Rikenellaceae bacterium]